MSDTIKKRFEEVSDKVNTSSSCRTWQPGKTRIIVVTKKKPFNACSEVIEAGATNIGENYPEEANEKYNYVNFSNVNFHMIGHLQSRKAKLLVPLFSYMHTIDRVDIAEKLSNILYGNKEHMKVLVEVNFTEENSKSGFRITSDLEKKNFFEYFNAIKDLPGISFCGLMTMGYFPSTAERNRDVYKKSRILLEEMQNKFFISEFNELSMGTSGDYLTAIQEGATFVRIGEMIMGPRMEKRAN